MPCGWVNMQNMSLTRVQMEISVSTTIGCCVHTALWGFHSPFHVPHGRDDIEEKKKGQLFVLLWVFLCVLPKPRCPKYCQTQFESFCFWFKLLLQKGWVEDLDSRSSRTQCTLFIPYMPLMWQSMTECLSWDYLKIVNAIFLKKVKLLHFSLTYDSLWCSHYKYWSLQKCVMNLQWSSSSAQ